MRRGWIMMAILALAAGAGALVLGDVLSLEALAANRDALTAWRDSHYLGAVLAFIAAYAAIVALSLPGATVATLTGGLLFGTFPGVIFNVTGATLGACLLFLAVRAGIGADWARRMAESDGRAGRLMARMRAHEWSVLFLIRLVPLVPFVLANLLPAFLGVRFHRFAISTFLGILPGGLVYTAIGAGLGAVFAAGQKPELGVILTPQVLLPMLGLVALAALPMIWKGRGHEQL